MAKRYKNSKTSIGFSKEIAFVVLALLALCFTLYSLSFVSAYAHDSIYYMPNHFTYELQRLTTEGRWLNALLFDQLKDTNGFNVSLLSLASFGFFIYYVLNQYLNDKKIALFMALLLLQAPSHYSQLLWPATSLPAYLLLPLSVLLYRYIPVWLFFVLFGVLSFGTLMQHYYLLPLLYLKQIGNSSFKDAIKRYFLPWFVGYIAGYGAAQISVYLYSGSWMVVSSWRNPHYIHSAHDLLININKEMHNIAIALKQIGFNFAIASIYIAGVALALYQALKSKKSILFFMLIAMAFLHFVAVIPYGLGVSYRTYTPLFVGLMLLFAIALNTTNKTVVLFLVAGLIVLLSWRNYHNLSYYSTITSIYKSEIKKASLHPPEQYNGVVLLQINHNYLRHAHKKMIDFYRLRRGKEFTSYVEFRDWVTSAMEAGYKGVSECTDVGNAVALFQADSQLNQICKKAIVSKIKNPNSNNLFYTHEIISGRQVISVNPNWDPSKPTTSVAK